MNIFCKKKILIIALALQFIFLGVFVLNWIGLELPILRQVIVFIYLTLVPGFLILRVFSVDRLSTAEEVLYSTGLSLSFLMFTGYVINLFYPLIGISKPISKMSLVFTIYILVWVLIFIVFFYRQDMLNQFNQLIFCIGRLSPVFYLFALIPFLSIFGSYFLNYYNNAILLLALFLIISLIPVFVTLDRVPSRLYPYIVWIISISLLFSVSLSVRFLSGHLSDATLEYYFARLVKISGCWHSSIGRNKNAALSIVMLHPIYSILLGISLKNTFRIVYPIIYSLTPVGLYISFKRRFGDKISFLSCFFFMSFYSFYVIFSRNTRTGVAELFLALVVLALTDGKLSSIQKKIFLLIFSSSIIISHYGTAYVFLAAIVFAEFIYLVFINYANLRVISNLSIGYIILYIILTFSWYIYNSIGSAFRTLVYFLNSKLHGASKLFSPKSSYAAYALSHRWVLSVEISKDLIFLASIFIVVGVVGLIIDIYREKETSDDFSIFSISFFLILVICFLLVRSFNPARVYHLALCFLSPFAVLGFVRICKIVSKLVFFKTISISTNTYLKIFILFLIIFFLFSSGFISEAIVKDGDYSPNIIISKPRAMEIHDTSYLKSFYGTYLFEGEVVSSRWIYQMKYKNTKIQMGVGSLESGVFISLMGPNDIAGCFAYIKNRTDVRYGYIYLSAMNVFRHLSVTNLYPPKVKPLTGVFPLNSCNRIYVNGCSEIYLKLK